jgi:hypothetical protein
MKRIGIESMKRIGTVGLCLVVAFVLSALVAASASATAPEYGRCLKQTSGEGKKFSDSKCNKEASGKKAKYEWVPGAGKAKFTSSGGIGVLTSVGGAGVECKTESSTGEFVPGNNKEEAGIIVTFKECKSAGNACTSPGAVSGELKTNELEGIVGFIKKEPIATKSKLGLELSPAKSVTSGLFIEFSCLGLVVKVRGHVLVPIKGNIMTKSETLKFSASKGKQKPEKWEESPEKQILEASFKGGPFEQAGQNITSVVTGEEALELNSVV